MRIAIFSRPGPCFPNVISQGLTNMLTDLGVESEIFYDSIPMLMRLLPLDKKPKRWHSNLQFRIRNKLINYFKDKKLIKTLTNYDAVIISECYPNAFWRNYLAIEEFKKLFSGSVISYTESPLDAAPLNKARLLDKDDYNESIYDFNLFVTDLMEVRKDIQPNQAVAGVNITHNPILVPGVKKEFIAVVDFAQPGFEIYRQQQIGILEKLGIKSVILEGRYPIDEIREIYRAASVFFISFPETFGLPIAECLACGSYIFSPDASWPMAWRLDEKPLPMEAGIFPDCFRIYNNDQDLEDQLIKLRMSYDPVMSPLHVFDTFSKFYSRFLEGDKMGVKNILNQISSN